MRFRTIFLWCLLPRLACSIWFSAIGYYGSGGDAQTYHILGELVRDQVRAPGLATIEARLYQEHMDPLEQSYVGHEATIEGLALGDEQLSTWRSSVLPVVLIHGFLYLLWDTPFAYVLFTSLLSAAATAYFVRAMAVQPLDVKWFAFNPASVYFAATHFKESLTEVLLLLIIVAMYRHRRVLGIVLPVILLGLFRFTYLPIILAFWVMHLLGLDRIKTRTLVFWVLALFLILPPFYLEHLITPETAGPVYSLVYSTAGTRKLLGPILGLFVPVPFTLPLSYGGYIGGVFYTVYGLYYWLLLSASALYVLLQTRSTAANVYLNLAALASLFIGYLYLGGSGLKDRYFAPFLPIMILAFVMIKPAVLRLFGRLEQPPIQALHPT